MSPDENDRISDKQGLHDGDSPFLLLCEMKGIEKIKQLAKKATAGLTFSASL